MMVKSAAGTPAFMAPEILQKGEYDAYGADVWSLGICLYNLVYGRVPFISGNKFETYRWVTTTVPLAAAFLWSFG